VTATLRTILCLGLVACGGASPGARPSEPAVREAQALALYEAMLVRDLDGDALEARQLRTELAAGWADTRAGRLAADSTNSLGLQVFLAGVVAGFANAAVPGIMGGDHSGTEAPPDVIEPVVPEAPAPPTSDAPPSPPPRKSKRR
jgi:hypothetical protein